MNRSRSHSTIASRTTHFAQSAAAPPEYDQTDILFCRIECVCPDAFLCAGLVGHALPGAARETIRPIALVHFCGAQIAESVRKVNSIPRLHWLAQIVQFGVSGVFLVKAGHGH
jgi:hypothetical protein